MAWSRARQKLVWAWLILAMALGAKIHVPERGCVQPPSPSPGASRRAWPKWQAKVEPTPGFAFDLQLRLMQVQHMLDDRQAQAGAAAVARAAGRNAVEALGEPGQVLGRNAEAGVAAPSTPRRLGCRAASGS